MNTRVETIYLSYLRRISFHIYVSVSLYLRNSTVLDAVIHQSSPYSWLKYIFFKLLTVLQKWQPEAHPSSKWPLIWESPVSYPMPPGSSCIQLLIHLCINVNSLTQCKVTLRARAASALLHLSLSLCPTWFLSLPFQEHPRTPHTLKSNKYFCSNAKTINESDRLSKCIFIPSQQWRHVFKLKSFLVGHD